MVLSSQKSEFNVQIFPYNEYSVFCKITLYGGRKEGSLARLFLLLQSKMIIKIPRAHFSNASLPGNKSITFSSLEKKEKILLSINLGGSRSIHLYFQAQQLILLTQASQPAPCNQINGNRKASFSAITPVIHLNSVDGKTNLCSLMLNWSHREQRY